MRVPYSFYGVLARIISFLFPVQQKCWVFGADYGNMYREGSKYLLEYMLKNHKDYNCAFVTRNRNVKKVLDQKGIPCVNNLSIRGMVTIAKAEAVFTCQTMDDILFAYRKANRKFFYLVHGQPLKIAMLALPIEYRTKYWSHKGGLLSKISSYLVGGTTIKDSLFVSANSDFLKPFMEKDFGGEVPVKVLGMPRNDALFDNDRMKDEKWIDDIQGKFVITYMPTHRKYGAGELSPSPFIDNQECQEWFRKNGVLILVKQHPNMIPKLGSVRQSDVIRDITRERLDPQVCIFNSDVLITDFSSVWMDYLLLRRPILFYIYDNFEQDDAGCHYDIREDPPGHFCKTEQELFELIKRCKQDYDAMKPSDEIVLKYHKYVDGNSCERYFKEIVGV